MTEASDRCGLVKTAYIAAMKPMITKPMTKKEYRAVIDELGISQQAAGRLFAVGSRTPRRWALGEARIPTAVAMILRLMLEKKLTLEVPIWDEVSHKWETTQIWELKAKMTVWE